MRAPSERNPRIDGLRGFLALFVVFFHCFGLHRSDSVFDGWIFNFIVYIVPVFFALSGYLVLQTFETRHEGTGGAFRQFYVGRIFRIMPLWVSIGLALYFLGFGIDVALAHTTFAYGFLIFDNRFLPIPPAWSLFVEEIFYLAFPLFLAVSRWPKSFVGFSVCFGISLLTYQYWSSIGWPSFFGKVDFLPFAHLHFFFIGAFIFQLEKSGSTAWRSFLDGRVGSAVSMLDIAVLMIILLSVTNVNVASIFTVPVLASLAFAKSGLFSAMLENRFLRWAGVRCFGIYAIHHLVLANAWRIQNKIPGLTDFARRGAFEEELSLFFVGLPATLVTAAISYSWLEKPALDYYKRRILGPSTRRSRSCTT